MKGASVHNRLISNDKRAPVNLTDPPAAIFGFLQISSQPNGKCGLKSFELHLYVVLHSPMTCLQALESAVNFNDINRKTIVSTPPFCEPSAASIFPYPLVAQCFVATPTSLLSSLPQ